MSDTLQIMKQRIRKILTIPEDQQRLFHRGDNGDERELDEDWRTLQGCGVKVGDTLLLVMREPWQHTDMATKTVRLTLPDMCAEAMDHVMDYMHRFHCDAAQAACGTSSRLAIAPTRDKSPSAVLSMLWLAGRMEMRDLQVQLATYLEGAVTADTAGEYVEPAARLGLVKVRSTQVVE
jgi:hypothetical protein